MRFFDKYNLRQTRPEHIINEYNDFCSSAKGDGFYRLENLEDASSFLVVRKDKSYLVERHYSYQEKFMGSSTRISYSNNAGFYCVGENIFLKSPTQEEPVEQIKSYEGFVITNGEMIDLTSVNAEYIYNNCKNSIEKASAELPVVAIEQPVEAVVQPAEVVEQ